MATTRASLSPQAASFPSTNAAALGRDSLGRMYLAFDATTNETAYWTLAAPQGLTGTMTAVVTFRAASATSGNTIFNVAVEAITSGDALDTGAASSFDTTNASSPTAVAGTAGYITQLSVTLTNQDSVAAGDMVRISLTRDAASANDNVSGDVHVLLVELRDAA